jgi:hypothetical protein
MSIEFACSLGVRDNDRVVRAFLLQWRQLLTSDKISFIPQSSIPSSNSTPLIAVPTSHNVCRPSDVRHRTAEELLCLCSPGTTFIANHRSNLIAFVIDLLKSWMLTIITPGYEGRRFRCFRWHWSAIVTSP